MDGFQDNDDFNNNNNNTFQAQTHLHDANNNLNNEEDEEDAFTTKQRLKAAMHYFVGQIAEQQVSTGALAAAAGTEQLTVSRHTVAAVAEYVYGFAETMAADLEAFAKHAKRSTINTDDVKLVARNSAELQSKLVAFSEKLTQAAGERKQNLKRKKKQQEPKADEPTITTSNKKASVSHQPQQQQQHNSDDSNQGGWGDDQQQDNQDDFFEDQ